MGAWDPGQYEKFKDERAQPFRDLRSLVAPRPGMRVADLGCGTGAMTLELHQGLGALQTVGIDLSAEMLAKAPSAPGLSFVRGDIAEFGLHGRAASEGPALAASGYDLIFSNAALHWVPDHRAVLRRLAGALAPGGQLAIQMPANDGHASHQAAFELARSAEFRGLLAGFERRPELLLPEQYASVLYELGFARRLVRLQVYEHLLPSADGVIEWVRGALLTDYQQRLSPADYERFLQRYRELLLPRLGPAEPFLYTYPRLFLWAQKAAGADEGARQSSPTF